MEDKLIGTALLLWGGKDVVVKLLGPTADYIGSETKNMVEQCHKNIGRIFNRATNLLGRRIDEPGVVSPRVLRKIVNEGAFCADFLSTEYFGGVLASSRTNIERDDRGMAILATISTMSTYQLRTHYILYSVVKMLFNGQNIKIGLSRERKQMQIFVPFDLYFKCMDFSEEETPSVIIPHIFTGLIKSDLIDQTHAFGTVEALKSIYPKVEKEGIIFTPSLFGIELYVWAFGRGDIQPYFFLDNKVQFESSQVLEIPSGAIAISQKK